MSYLDLLPSDLTRLLDVYVHHGYKVALFPFTISEYKDARWSQIIKEDLSEGVMYECASEFLSKDWTWIDNHVVAMHHVDLSNFPTNSKHIRYHLRGQVCQDVRLLFLDFYYRYARKELV